MQFLGGVYVLKITTLLIALSFVLLSCSGNPRAKSGESLSDTQSGDGGRQTTSGEPPPANEQTTEADSPPEKTQTLMSDLPELIQSPPVPLLEQISLGLRPGVLNDSPIDELKVEYVCKDNKHGTDVEFTYNLLEFYNGFWLRDTDGILCVVKKSYVDVPTHEQEIQSTDRFGCRGELNTAIATRSSEGYECYSHRIYIGVIGRKNMIRIL